MAEAKYETGTKSRAGGRPKSRVVLPHVRAWAIWTQIGPAAESDATVLAESRVERSARSLIPDGERFQMRYDEEVLRGLARSARHLLDGQTAAVLIADVAHDAEGSVRVYGPNLERLPGGGRSFAPASHVVTNLMRRLLETEVTRCTDVRQKVGYLPLWSESAELDGDAQIILSIRRIDHLGVQHEPIGMLIVQRARPFSEDDEQTIRALADVARAAITGTMPVVVCQRCDFLVADGTGLAAVVAGEWHYGHKRCFDHRETPTWMELGALRENPLHQTYRATTDAAVEPDWLTARAVTSWYRMLEEVFNIRILRWNEDDTFDPVHGYVVADDERDADV